MKKLLALVLAMVMTLGLATVGASAATVKYADKNDIDYQEAADVLSTVGVFEGKGENFAPKDNLNRAEAAKLIAYLMLGNKTAEAIKGNGNRFSDVPADHWACGYIEYLASAGVVSGVGGGNFNPNGQVTAVQFAKMLNVALGYDAQVEGYVGESWNINIMKQANDDKIFDALEIGSNDVLTREQAAQMCLNALKADVVEYESKGDTLTINNSTVVLNAKKAKDKISGDSKAMKVKNDPVVGGYTLQLGEDRYNGDLEMVETRDDFGRPASEWRYKTEKIGTYVKNGDILKTYTDEVKRGPLYDVLGKAIYDDLIDNKAILYYTEDGVPYDGNLGIVNNFDNKATNKTEIEKFVQKNGDKAINAGNSTGNGTLTEVFVNDDHNVITISVINTYAYKASSDYRASTEDIVIAPVETAKINLDSTRLTLEDFPEIKDLKKDDYILITAHQNTNSNNYEAKSAVKAEVLTAKVDKYIYDDNVTLDGNVTKYSKKAAGDSKITEYSVGQETTVVLDKYGYIIYVDEAVVSNNYVFISELYQGSGSSTSKVKANAYFVDGTNSEITVKEISGLSSLTKTDMADKQGSLAAATTTIGVVKNDRYAGWYTYNKNSSGEYTLNAVPTNSRLANGFQKTTTGELTKSDTVAFINSTATLLTKDGGSSSNTFYQLNGKAANTIKANDKTVMVVTYAENNDVDIYTGVKNLPDITLNNADATKAQGEGIIFVVNDTSSYARFVFVSLKGNWSVYGTENESLLYIIKTDKKNVVSSDTTYYTYKALDEDAKEIKVEGDGNNVFGSATYMAFYKTSKNADGRYTRGSKVPNSTLLSPAKYINTATLKSSTTGYGIAADNGALTIAGDSFTLDNNYKLVVVSQANALNKLKDTDYEASVVSADSLAAMVSGYDVEYYMQAKLKDNYVPGKGGKIIEAYVTITSAVANGKASSGSTTASGILKLMLPADLLKSEPVTIYYAGSSEPTGQQVNDALASELLGTGYSIKKMVYDSTNRDYVFDLENASGATFEKALRYDWDNQTYSAAAGGGAGGLIASAKVSTIKSVGLSGTATAADSAKFTAINQEVLFVGKNDSLVIPANVTLTVPEAYIDGTVTVQNGGTLTIGAGTKLALTDMIITKSGHVTVKTGGTLNAATATVDVEYGSTSLENAGTVNIGTLNANGRVASTGGTFTTTGMNLNNGGTFTVSGGTVAGPITVNSGASMTTSGTATVKGNIGLAGGALTVGGSSMLEGTTTVSDKTSTLAINDDAKVTTVTNSSSDSFSYTTNGTNNTVAKNSNATVTGTDKFLLTVDPTNPSDFAVTATSLSQKSQNVYYLSKDATTFSITVKNTKTYSNKEVAQTTFDVKVTAPVDSEGKTDYSLSQNSVTLAEDGTATITVSNSKGVKGNVTINIAEQPSSSGDNG